MTTFNDMVSKLAKPGETIADELTPRDAHIIHMAMGVSGETGELVDIIKKATMYRKDIDMAHVIEEMGDIEFYLEGLRQGLRISRDEVIKANMDKLGKRYSGFNYSDQRAKERADKNG
jgi:NTP pyrophosphatase (non-canonical NTP hydrolase)